MQQPITREEKAQRILQMHERTRSEFNVHQNAMRVIADYCRPSNDTVDSGDGKPQPAQALKRHTRLFDTTASRAVIKHAAGVKSWMSSSQKRWFLADPPVAYKHDEEVIKFYMACTEVMEQLMKDSVSSFHTEDQEAMQDGCAFGIRCLFVDEPQKDGSLLVQQWEPGSFACEENNKGRLDKFVRVKEMTAQQAKSEFGEANLPEKVRADLMKEASKGNKHTFIHAIYPREDDERNADHDYLAQNKAIASCWVHLDSKTLVRESGFDEMPVIGSRYLKKPGSPYGIGAALVSLADARQLNYLQERIDVMIGLLVNPTMNVPSEFDASDVNLGEGGINYYNDPQRMITPMQRQVSNGQQEMARVQMRREDIRDAFFLNIFEAVSRKTKEMSALEADLVSKEAIELFSPMFTLMTGEHYQPALSRIFLMYLRQSEIARAVGDVSRAVFPPIPKKLLREIKPGLAEFPTPQFSYTSRIALALQQLHSQAFNNSLMRRTQLGNIIGEAAFDDINLPVALKEMDRSDGLPENWFRSPQEVQQMQQNRAQQAQLQAMAAAAKDGSAAVKNIKGTPLEGALQPQ